MHGKEYYDKKKNNEVVYLYNIKKNSKVMRAKDRKQENESIRTISCQYILKKCDSISRVCKTMFLNTLSIGELAALQ